MTVVVVAGRADEWPLHAPFRLLGSSAYLHAAGLPSRLVRCDRALGTFLGSG